MWPLAYRADGFFQCPLHVAATYDTNAAASEASGAPHAILRELLRLPILLHQQPGCKQYPALHHALISHSWQEADMLLEAGFAINMRDFKTGLTPLATALTDLVSGTRAEKVHVERDKERSLSNCMTPMWLVGV